MTTLVAMELHTGWDLKCWPYQRTLVPKQLKPNILIEYSLRIWWMDSGRNC